MEIEDQPPQFQPLAHDQDRKQPKQSREEETESNNNGGGLFLKLLMMKMPKAESLSTAAPPSPPKFVRICEVCNKGFSSGKALGGHMRMHVQANRELMLQSRNNTSKLLQKPKSSYLSSSNGAGGFGIEGNNNMNPVCSVCGKSFPSPKSLYGHMRSHPEREWRGINPPATAPTAAKNSSSSTLSDDVVDGKKGCDDGDDQIDDSAGSKTLMADLSKTLPGWSHTARRGRKSMGSSSESVSGLDLSSCHGGGVDQDQMEEAVHDLLMLAQGPDQMCEATNSNWPDDHGSKEEKIDEDEDLVGTTRKRKGVEKKWFDEYRDGKRNGNGKGKDGLVFGQAKSMGKNLNVLKLELEKNEEEFSDNSESFVLASANVSLKKKKRRKMKLADLEESDIVIGGAQKLRYRCSLCDKSFPTHQALGGHMSNHNKLKNTNTTIINHSSHHDHDHQSGSADGSAGEDGGAHVDQAAQHHQCKICNKNFPTGQALGGHKRCHWTGPTEQQQQEQLPPAQSSSSNGKKVLNFDLNELPSMEEEEDAEGTDEYGGAAAGYPTSSYNSVT